jgi:hypothetical protein
MTASRHSDTPEHSLRMRNEEPRKDREINEGRREEGGSWGGPVIWTTPPGPSHILPGRKEKQLQNCRI